MGTYTVLVNSLVFLVSLQYTAAIRCLNCNDVIQPRYCSGIEHCPTGDTCVTESYRNKNGEYLYNVGCMSTQRCSLTTHPNRSADFLRSDILGTHVHDVCTECCHSDLCNAAGCGTDGFPQQRGPVCLDCPQSRDPADCDVISVCLQSEVCQLEELHKFGEVFYKTSCSRKTDYECASPPIYNPVEVGKRSTGRGNCSFCCPDDLCNTKCNAVTSLVPSTVESTKLTSSTVQTTLTLSTVPTTLTLSTVPTTPAPSTVQTTLAPIRHSFKGKQFFLMFMEAYEFIYSKEKLSFTVTSINMWAHLRVITRHTDKSPLIYGPVKQIAIDANMTMRDIGKASKGIIVISDGNVSVTALNRYKDGIAEGYLALPFDSLGTSYVVGTFRPNSGPPDYTQYGTSFAVGAPYDYTVVNITLSEPGVSIPGQYHREGDTITVVLNRLDTFYIATYTKDQDLTGTRIVSDKPVAVVSGNICSGTNGCNHLVEYLPPISKWGSTFMVPPLMSSTNGIIRIIPSVAHTKVVVTSKTSNDTYTVYTVIDMDTTPSQPYAISSNQPILVLLIFSKVQYAMSIVPSINQFSNESVMVSPLTVSFYNLPFDNYIVVSIRSRDKTGLQLRSVVTGTDLPVETVDFPDANGEVYSFLSAPCNGAKACSVQHSDTNVTFSVIAFGFASNEAYAYPANLML